MYELRSAKFLKERKKKNFCLDVGGDFSLIIT